VATAFPPYGKEYHPVVKDDGFAVKVKLLLDTHGASVAPVMTGADGVMQVVCEVSAPDKPEKQIKNANCLR
jgi:hypothetical protein